MMKRTGINRKSSLLALLIVVALASLTTLLVLHHSENVARANGGPVGYWTMNESSWSGVSFDVTDISGNANHGKAMGGANTTGGGVCGATGLFDGDDDYILVPNSASLDIAGDELTLEAWVKWNVDPRDWAHQGWKYRWANIINKNGDHEWRLQHGPDNHRFEFYIGTVSGGSWVRGTTEPQQGEWYHVVGVYDGSHVHIYVNGQLENSKSRSGNIAVSATPVNIGRMTKESRGRYFPGLIDEVRIYDRALTPSEIQTHYENDPCVQPCLTIDKDVITYPPVVAGGGNVSYRIAVENSGGCVAENAYIRDELPGGFTYNSSSVNYTAGVTYTGDDDFGNTSNPRWGNFTIPSGGSVTIEFTADIADTVDGDTYDNTAYIWCDCAQMELDDDGSETQDSHTPAGEDPEDDEDVTVQAKCLTIDKDVVSDPAVVSPGDQVTYQIRLIHQHDCIPTGVYVRDDLPAGFTYASTDSIELTGGSTHTGDDDFGNTSNPRWGNFTIQMGGSVTITFTVDVAGTVADGTYDNTAYNWCPLTHSELDDEGDVAQDDDTPPGLDPEDDEDVTVMEEDVTIDKDVVTDPAVVQAGGQVTYQINVSHTDPSHTEAGFYIWDDLPEGFTYNSTDSITETGGATRTSVDNPVPGVPEPAWGIWNISGVGSITIEFTVDVDQTVSEGIYDNTAYVWHPAHGHEHDDDGEVAQDDDTPPGEDPEEDEDVRILPPGCEEVETATDTGTGRLCVSSGTMGNLTAVSESTLPAEGKPSLTFPHGFFSFNITGLSNGESVTVTITLPSAVPVGTQYWKYGPTPGDGTDHWYQLPMGDNDGDNIITITLVDNGLGDDVLTGEDSEIVDQGGPGVPPVGGEVYPVNRLQILAPWIALAVLLIGGLSWFTLRRWRPQS